MAQNDADDDWESRGAVRLEDADVYRKSWDNQPDGFRLKVRFKREVTDEEIAESFGYEEGDTTVDLETYSLGSLVRENPAHDGDGYLFSRNDVTNDVVEAALERALWLYCSNRFDPGDVCVHRVRVEEYREIRTVEAGNENDMGVGQPHAVGDLPEWADE